MKVVGTKRYLVTDIMYDGDQRTYLVTATCDQNVKIILENRIHYLVSMVRNIDKLGEWEFCELKGTFPHFQQHAGEKNTVQTRDLFQMHIVHKATA